MKTAMKKSKIDIALEFVKSRSEVKPDVALVLGSGLGELAEDIKGTKIKYRDIPGFPVSTAPSHKGVLHIGDLFGCKVVAMQGRVHLYEGYKPSDVIFPMQIMASLGAKSALLTNAAGGINQSYSVGDLVCVEDHLSMANLAGNDPLRGPNNSKLGDRFVSMNKAYDPSLIEKIQSAGNAVGVDLKRGVYAFVTGPTFETPAEIRMLRGFGCDLVGMSTVPSVIAARHMGLKVAVISAVTNMAVSTIDDAHITNEEEVWESVKIIRPKLKRLVSNVLTEFGTGGSDD